MHITLGRRTRLAMLGAGLITAATVGLSSAATAFADTADTGGTATVSLPRSVVVGLAKHGVIALPGSPATSSYTAGASNFSSSDACTFTVTGGTGEISNFSGIIDLGGSIVLVNAAHSQTVTISNLELNFFTGALTGMIGSSTSQTTIAWVSGNLSSSTGTGTESFSASQLLVATKGATALNAALGVKAFTHGTNLGGFATTYDVTIT